MLKRIFLIVLLVGCSSQSSTDQIIRTVNQALTIPNCDLALSTVLPIYESSRTENQIRFATAQAYGCKAKIDFTAILVNFVTQIKTISSNGLWKFLSTQFASTTTPDDRMPQNAMKAMDAAFSVLTVDSVLPVTYKVNSGSYNPGSVSTIYRELEANLLSTFISMSMMGSLLSRYGQPQNGVRTVDLPWSVSDQTAPIPDPPWEDTDTKVIDGCALAAGLLSFLDGISTVLENTKNNDVQKVYSSVGQFLEELAQGGCALGCTLCGLTCQDCPMTLRHYSSCQNKKTDINTCAAIGLITAINTSWSNTP